MSIHESGENYLEQIYMLSHQKEKIRAVDLCTALGFSRPTVSVMLRELRAEGFVTTAENGGLALTQKGEDVAKRMYERHCIIAEVLMRLGVSQETALNDACKIEHDISDETFLKIREYLDQTK
ncbi:MAG: metal-dependent transcriptional regulator [Clostridia bacterium]|nr:metal-dependent transcriptional regulator [Clostridia bacterium]MBQ8717597.1 metal-dependent transcriptional regulator [Clostridia bacterium]